jgi:lysine 6-dehydrogenase
MEAIRELGLIDNTPLDVKGTKIVPRDVAVAAMGPHLRKPMGRDLVALRVIVEGTKSGKPVTHTFQFVDRHDEKRGITAMERTTGYSLSITGQLQAERAIAPAGVRTPDECVPGDRYIAELAKRGIVIQDTQS